MLKVYKKLGLTPLGLIHELRNEKAELQNVRLAYAGRLDPMAEGEMLILVGDECKNRKQYERLDKEYEFSVLFGVSTDTYDILGKVINFSSIELSKDSITQKLSDILPDFTGKQIQEYPPYSSPRIKGKSLWWWAKEDRLSEIKIPQKEIEICEIKLLKVVKLQSKEVQNTVIKNISTVVGEFRQQKILDGWNLFFVKNKVTNFTIATLKVTCSSGTYIRSLVHDIGRKLSVPSVTFSLIRTKIIYQD